MKRTFLTTLTAVTVLSAMVGCTKNDQITAVEGESLSFETYVGGNTKGLSKSSFKMGDQFGILATMSVNDWSTSDNTWFMGLKDGNQPEIVATNTDLDGTNPNAWKYGTVKLWPEKEKLSFFAYSPVDPSYTVSTGIGGSPVVSFSVNPIIKEQVDFLAAESLNQTSAGGAVSLQFRHTLTRVTFAAKANVSGDQMVRLEKIELVGVKSTGKLKLYDPMRVAGDANDMGGWTNQDTPASFTPALTHEVVGKVPSTVTPMTAEDQALFMIPQEFTKGGDAKLLVTYAYTNDGKSWVNNAVIEIDLAEYTQYWNPAKNYRYTLSLSPDKIYTFGGTIDAWNADLDVDIKKPLSVELMSVEATGGNSEFIVNETRGMPLGYKITSSDASWLKISENPDGTSASEEVTYDKNGNVTTKVYDMSKKWYLVTATNTTGADRTAKITLIRDSMTNIVMDVTQIGLDPFKDCVLDELNAGSEVVKVTGLVVPANPSKVYKIKAKNTWFTLSKDGQGAGSEELTFIPQADPHTFYVHVPLNTTATRTSEIQFLIDGIQTNKMAVKQLAHPTINLTIPTPQVYYMGTPFSVTGLDLIAGIEYTIESNQTWGLLSLDGAGDGAKTLTFTPTTTGTQKLYLHPYTNTTASSRSVTITVKIGTVTMSSKAASQAGNADKMVGSFAGAVVTDTKTVAGETHYYFDKMLFAAPADESSAKWQNTASATTAKSIIDGKANTLALKNLGGTPAATACWNKSSTPANQYYLPALNQLTSMWIAKSALGSFNVIVYWSSTDNSSNNAFYVGLENGYTDSYYNKTTAHIVRCVREGISNTPAAKVIKDADGKVYIDVQGMPSGAWSSSSLAGTHNETSAKNSVFKRIEIDKSDKAKAAQTSPGCSSGWRLPTQRELQLIWIMKDALVKAGVNAFVSSFYWSSTDFSSTSGNVWDVNFSNGNVNGAVKSQQSNIRCIREVN